MSKSADKPKKQQKQKPQKTLKERRKEARYQLALPRVTLPALTTHSAPPPGRLMHGVRRYDLQMWLRTLGRERAFRREILDLAHLAEGESVLDVGCGTGSLALAAKRRVGPSGVVHGIDPSPEMVERARSRARPARLEVRIEQGVAQTLELPDASVDVVFAMLVLHHLPHDALVGAGGEIRRVL